MPKKKKRKKIEIKIPILPRAFICPLCNQPTTVLTPHEFIYMKRATCNECKKEFVIENDKPRP